MECPFCVDGWLGKDREVKCEHCDRDGIIECTGSGDPEDFLEDEDPSDVFLLAKLVLVAREKEWGPEEYLSQSAVFVQAFERIFRVVAELTQEERERLRRELEREHARRHVPTHHP